MDKFWAWWALIFYILPVFIAIPLIRRRRRGVNSLLTGIALKYDGTIKSIMGIPYYVGFELDGKPVSLSLSHSSRNSPAQTQLAAELSAPAALAVWIGPENKLITFGKRWGLQDIEVMRPDFDAKFLVRGPEEHRIREFLTPQIQELLLKWQSRQATLNVKDNRFRFIVYELIGDEALLEEFIEDAGTLLEKTVGHG